MLNCVVVKGLYADPNSSQPCARAGLPRRFGHDISGDLTQGTCGDGVINGNETCDDGNTVSGDGCSAACQTEDTSSPHVVLTVDKPTITSDLNVSNTIMVTATGMMNFSGDLTLTVAAADASATPIADWTATFDSGTLEVSTNGTATAMLTLSAMGDTAALTGNVTVTASGGNATTPATATFATIFNPVLDVMFSDNNGVCGYPIGHGVNETPYKIKPGRQIMVYNGSASLGMVVHADNGNIAGFSHEEPESAPGTPHGMAYPQTISATATVGGESTFYCHATGDPTMLASGAAADYRVPCRRLSLSGADFGDEAHGRRLATRCRGGR